MAGYPDRYTDPALATAAFLMALDEFPAWAIEAAAAAWIGGRRDVYPTANFAFPPAPGQLAETARSLIQPVVGEEFRLRRLLAAVADEMPDRPPAAERKAQVEALRARMAEARKAAGLDTAGLH